MRLLIIWEEDGVRLRMYEELVTPDEFKAISAAHGHFIGCDNGDAVNKALDFLNEWLQGRTPFYDTSEGNQPIREIAACSIIHCGFVP